MAESIKFHLDENVDPAIATALRRHGIDVTTTPEAGLRTQGDQSQLAFSLKTGRVLVTHDTDFLRIAKQSVEHAGIAYSSKHRSLGHVIRALIRMRETLPPDAMAGRVEFI